MSGGQPRTQRSLSKQGVFASPARHRPQRELQPTQVTFLSPEEVAAGRTCKSWTVLDITGMNLRALSLTLFTYQHLTALYLNNNKLVTISPDIVKLRSLVVLDLSGNDIEFIPPEMGRMFQMRNLLLYNNKINTLPYELGSLYKLDTLGLRGNPLQEPFSSIAEDGTTAITTFLLDNAPVPPTPPERPWVTYISGVDDSKTFTVFCYNVLCAKYCTRELYGYCPTWALEWNYRKQQILREILTFSGDLVCLQEVEGEQFYDFFQRELHVHGYNGIFKPKSRARTMSETNRKHVDGCAIFYRHSKFNLIEDHLIEFSQVSTAAAKAFQNSDDLFNRVMVKDNIALVLQLENKITKAPVVICNAHMHWDPAFKDVKVIQTALLMEEVNKIIKAMTPPVASVRDVALIVCGDFNSLPDSGVFEFMSNSVLPGDHTDFKGRKYGTYVSCGLRHPFTFRHSHDHDKGRVPFTNFTYDFTGIIDYIWYSTGRLAATGVLGPVSEDYLSTFAGCPNPHFSSDHMPLFTEFVYKSASS